MASGAYLDSANKNLGSNVIEKSSERVNVTTSSIVSGIKLVEYDNVDTYSFITRRVHEDYEFNRVLFPVEQQPLEKMKLLYDVRLIQCDNNPLEIAPIESRRGTPHIAVQLKPEVYDMLMNEGVQDPTSSFNRLRFYELIYFKNVARLIREYGSVIYSAPRFRDAHVINGTKVLVYDAIPGRNMRSIIDGMRYAPERSNLLARMETLYVQTDNTADIDLFGRAEPEVAANRDQIDDYTVNAVPILPLEHYMLQVGIENFSNQYCHPRVLKRMVEDLLPNYITLDQVSKNQIASAHPNVRLPKPHLGLRRYQACYYFNGVMRAMRTTINSLIKIDLALRNHSNTLNGMYQILHVSNTAQRKGDNIGEYINHTALIEMVTALYKVWLNPNLWIIDVAITTDMLQVSLYNLLSVMCFVKLVPPNVVPVATRFQINNAVAYLIMYNGFGKNQNVFPVADGFPDNPGDQKWRVQNVDYLLMIYEHALRKMNITQRAPLMKFFAEYWGPDHAKACQRIMLERGGIREEHPMSIILPYLHGTKGYTYSTDAQYADLREALCGNGRGPVLPCGLVGDEGMSQLIKASINCTTILLDMVCGRDGLYPSRYPDESRAKDILFEVSCNGVSGMSQIFFKYRNNLAKFMLCPVVDNVYEHSAATKDKVFLYWDIKTTMSLYLLLASIEDTEQLEMPEFMYNIPIVIRAEFFVATYAHVCAIAMRMQNVENLEPYLVAIKLNKKHRIAITTEIVKEILGDSSFDPFLEFLSPNSDAAELNRILEIIPRSQGPITLVDEYFKIIGRVMNVMRPIAQTAMYYPEIYVAKHAIHSALRHKGMAPQFLAANTVCRSRLKVVHTINSMREFEELIDAQADRVGAMMGETPLQKLWETLEDVSPSYQLRTENAVVPVIYLRVPVMLTPRIIYVSQWSDVRVDKKGATFDDLVKAYKGFSRNIAEARLLTVPITILINDLAANPLDFEITESSVYRAMANLATSEIIVPFEDVVRHMSNIFYIQDVSSFLDTSLSNVTLRKTPFNLVSEMPLHLTSYRA